MFEADTLIRDSYSKFKDNVYQIRATEGPRILIPVRFLPELKCLPEDTLSAQEAVHEALLAQYTHFSAGPHSETLSKLLRNNLSQRLSRLTPKLKDELDFITAQEFPECDDWTPFNAQPFLVRTVARLSGCAFAGRALSRAETWMDTTVNYATTVFLAAIKLQFFPTWARPAAQYLIPDLYEIPRMVDRAEAMLTPIIEERLRRRTSNGSGAAGSSTTKLGYYDEKNGKVGEDDKGDDDDFLQWLLDALPEDQKTRFDVQAHLQLILSAASIHTTSNLVTDCVYDLAEHQELQDILRQEAAEVLELGGEGKKSDGEAGEQIGCQEEKSGWFAKDGLALARLRKLDSFMRESQRLHGNVTSFIRKVMRPIDLSDGTHLPAGASLLAPLAGVSRDDRFYPDAETFDGLRFWRLQQAQEQERERERELLQARYGNVANSNSNNNNNNSNNYNNSSQWQFTSIGDTNTSFGLGRHACPGRFFAAAEAKMILAHLLLRYDIKLKEGEGRPRPMMFMMTKCPSPSAEILFKRRKGNDQTMARAMKPKIN
ncbi:hypothetical protein SLS62_006793 [Diatrype stigma]|uniref:Cytochrome P450 n=1 Tax=Diatrype stigma TaxID=117547 RepID=A0AAN9YMK7_9PEZI